MPEPTDRLLVKIYNYPETQRMLAVQILEEITKSRLGQRETVETLETVLEVTKTLVFTQKEFLDERKAQQEQT